MQSAGLYGNLSMKKINNLGLWARFINTYFYYFGGERGTNVPNTKVLLLS